MRVWLASIGPPLHVLLALLLLCLARPTLAGEPPTEPILRIEPGDHTSIISGIAVDAEGRWLVTASHDKTARVWNLADGGLITTLRYPIGPDNEGKAAGVAITPNGKLVAVGGWTGFDWDRVATVFLFERESGRLLRRLGEVSGQINRLAFSPDGQNLAVTATELNSGSKRNSVSIFSVANNRLVGQDLDYGDAIPSIEFSLDGRLLTASLDGYLRLYSFNSQSLSLAKKQLLTEGKQPFAARFSPDGRRIAVSFNDTAALRVLDGSTLTVVLSPDTSGLNKRTPFIAWSPDGVSLYAAGFANTKSGFVIRRWAEGGAGAIDDWSVATAQIMGLAALVGGRLVFSTFEPSWGVLDPSGKTTIHHKPVVANFLGLNAKPEGFRLSRDGFQVRFVYRIEDKDSVAFDSIERSFIGAETPTYSPMQSSPNLAITDWKGPTPKLSGALLKMDSHEASTSIAIFPEGNKFVLGTTKRLRAFDRMGNEIWVAFIPGFAYAVNISQDGRWVVAAYSDGTIRWHRASDGVEQVAFYPHPDKKRWVLWTPGGYFAASPGGEDLIGWHLNRGKDHVADFFPASRFRSQFHRPDVLAKVLEIGDEKKGLELANAEAGRKTQAVAITQVLPPVVEILSPNEGTAVSTASVMLRYATRSPNDAPITGLRLRVNGLAVSLPEARNLTVSAVGTREISVPIPPQDSEIQLFAENKNGVSVPAILRVTWAGSKPAVKDEVQYKPKLYVLAVGVSKYANPDFNLGLAAKDATDFAAVLQQQKGKLYGDVKVRLLTDGKATRDDVVDGLEWLKREVTARDVGIMFLAGHGMNDNTGKYYFLPHNADLTKLLRTGVPQTDIKDTLNSLAGKAIFFVDTCHSGNALGSARTRSVSSQIDAFVNELTSAENGVVVFTAATGRQLSQESDSWGNGAFTKAVVEGLSGKADFQKTGKITHKGLDYYVAERVKVLTNGTQSPVSITPQGITDFPIAVVQ